MSILLKRQDGTLVSLDVSIMCDEVVIEVDEEGSESVQCRATRPKESCAECSLVNRTPDHKE